MYLTLNLVSLTVWRSSSAGWALTIRSPGNSSTGRWPPLVGGWVLATQWRTIHNSWLLKTAINSAYQPSIWRSSASLRRNVSIILTDMFMRISERTGQNTERLGSHHCAASSPSLCASCRPDMQGIFEQTGGGVNERSSVNPLYCAWGFLH